jgi:hypothetical protein
MSSQGSSGCCGLGVGLGWRSIASRLKNWRMLLKNGISRTGAVGASNRKQQQESKSNSNEKVIKDCEMLNREQETAETRPFEPF